MLYLAYFIFRALARIDVGDVNDCLFVRVENRKNIVNVRPTIEEVANVESFKKIESR